ncbi:MAG: type II/IV secretion system ATPase subunit [Desulfurococcaceae archaeon]
MRKSSAIAQDIAELVSGQLSRTGSPEGLPSNYRVVDHYSISPLDYYVLEGEDGSLKYFVNEPAPTSEDVELLARALALDPFCVERRCAEALARRLGARDSSRFAYLFLKLTSSYGPIYPLVIDPNVEDVFVEPNSVAKVMHTKYSWYGWIETNVFIDSSAVDSLAIRIARTSNRSISYASPLVEGMGDGGTRFSISFGNEISRKGSTIVIRRRANKPLTMPTLINDGVLCSVLASYLWLVLEARGWIVVAGGVGAGKTTFLQALLTLVPPQWKVVTIEDTPEILGTTGIWDPLVEVAGAKGGITMYDLLRASLRRRPDLIVVGEVRGAEAKLLVQASRLGHGVLNTFHADSPKALLERMASPPISIPRELLDNIWTIVVVSREGPLRKVATVEEVLGGRLVKIHSLEEGCADPELLAERSRRLQQRLDVSALSAEIARRAEFLEGMVSKGIFELGELAHTLRRFYSGGISLEKAHGG